MARTDTFSGLIEFLSVARQSSFRAAGAELGVTPSAVSQAIRSLEARVGVPLFQRTTRKVALTDAGATLLGQLLPAATTIAEAMQGAAAARARPAGNLRLSVPRIALPLVLWDLLPAFRTAYPDITVDLDVSDASADLLAGQFDAGIRMGEYIQRDMVAVRLTEDFRNVIVGSPGYFRSRGRPASPKDLPQHECIRYRFPTARTVYRWEFVKGRKTYSVEPPGGTTVNDHLSMIELACRGMGLAYTLDLLAQHAVKAGVLEEALAPHLPKTAGLFLYFPARSQGQPKLRTFIDFANERLRGPREAPPQAAVPRRPRRPR
ncbi:MAG TPA: LysR family transcriptional regulator [Ramlibacter sp.]|nr:LysR family transcriptional regulator [Ramlibacter sp.]